MKKVSILIIALFLCGNIFAQETIKAELEHIGSIPVSIGGKQDGTVGFDCNDYETYFPLGPLVDEKGNLYFYNYFSDSKIKYSNGKVIQERIVRNGNLPMSMKATSSNGIVIGSEGYYLFKDDIYYERPVGIDSDYKDYFIFKKGVLYLYKNPEKAYAIDITGKESKVIENNQLEDWLMSMGYSLKENRVYKNDRMIVSLITKRSFSNSHGCLRTYHSIYESKNNFIIYNQNNEVVFKIELQKDNLVNSSNGFEKYTYGFGNYGEIYIIIGPDDNESRHSYTPSLGNAELYIIRNHLKYFGILNDDRIRLRKGPGTDTESLGTYPIKTGFMILEDSGVKQTIDGVTKTWIKVRLLDGTEGYFFGQYVQNLYDGPGTPLPWPNVADWD